MAYFAALLARSADEWRARDVDMDEVDDGMGLVEFIREACEDEEPDTAVVLLEREDAWFAVVRLDLDEDPRVFASDLAGVSRSGYADLLTAGSLPPVGPNGEPLEALAGAAVAQAVPDEVDEDRGRGGRGGARGRRGVRRSRPPRRGPAERRRRCSPTSASPPRR